MKVITSFWGVLRCNLPHGTCSMQNWPLPCGRKACRVASQIRSQSKSLLKEELASVISNQLSKPHADAPPLFIAH